MQPLDRFYYFILALKKYAQFSGRSTRSEFWYFHLYYLAYAIALVCFTPLMVSFHNEAITIFWSCVLDLFPLTMFLPSVAIAVRRLHDTNRSGWWFLLMFTVIGIVPLIVFYCQESDLKANRFGDIPDTLAGNMRYPVKTSLDNLDAIEKLAELRDKNILTEEEFQRKKSELL